MTKSTPLVIFLAGMLLLTAVLQSGFLGLNWTPLAAAERWLAQ